MKNIIVITAAILTAISYAETDQGVVYGTDYSAIIGKSDIVGVDLWVAGTESGVLFDRFNYVDKGPTLAIVATITGTRGISFKGYVEPFFGKVADIWFEGLFGNYPGTGKPAIVHFRTTDPPGSSMVKSYMTIDVYQPGNLSTPYYSRFLIGNNILNVLIPINAGGMAGAEIPSSTGWAYSLPYKGYTNRYEPVQAYYKVYSNGILDFEYSSSAIGFMSKRLRSFKCTNSGFFGKQAEFWLDGYSGPAATCAFTPQVARVIVTQSSGPLHYDFMYIAFYDPYNLTTPVYERFINGDAGQNHILCK